MGATVEEEAKLAMLAARAQSGDRVAATDLFYEIAPRIRTLCAILIGSPQGAEDAAQEAEIKIFRSLRNFDSRCGRFVPWLYINVRSICKDHLRNNRHARFHVPLMDGMEAAIEFEDGILHEFDLERCLEKLDDRRRDVFERFFCGEKQADIAKGLETSINNVSRWLTESYEKLQKCLGYQASERKSKKRAQTGE